MLLVKTTLQLSPIHGIGLFAGQFIASGATVWSYLDGFDLRLPPSILEVLSAPAREQFLTYAYRLKDSGLYELCSDDGRYFNHADAPNTASLIQPDGSEKDVALRDIHPGEELTCDYRTFDLDWQRKLGR